MRKIVTIMVCLSILAFTGIAAASILDFEDLYPGYEMQDNSIDSPYHGFNMSEHAGFMTKNYIPNSGYYYGTSGHGSMFTAWEDPITMNSGPFNLISADITAAWNTEQDFTVEGWRGGVLIYSSYLTTSNDAPYNFTFNFLDIDMVKFIPGTLGTEQHHLCIDNIVYSTGVVPLPGAVWLLGSGLLGLAGLKRFK